MIEIRISAMNADEARLEMSRLLAGSDETLPAALPPLVSAAEPSVTHSSVTAGLTSTGTTTEKRPSGRSRAKINAENEAIAAAELRAINSGGVRTDPAAEAQDEADEKAETEGAKTQAKKLTLDDVREVLGAYVRKFGMSAAQEDGPKALLELFGKPKISDIPETQEDLHKAVSYLSEMLHKNTYRREVLTGPAAAEAERAAQKLGV